MTPSYPAPLMMSAAFVGSATRELERERAITTVSSSSAREMPPGAGPAGAVLDATVGSLAGAVMNATPPRFGRSERRMGASDGASLNDISPSSSVAAGVASRAAMAGSRAGAATAGSAATLGIICYLL